MPLTFVRAFGGLIALLFSIAAHCATSTPNAELTAILQKLSESATPEQVKQITGAITASPMLTDDLNELAKAKKLNEIRVTLEDFSPETKGVLLLFSQKGATLVFSTPFLISLLKYRPNAVIKDGDLPPNNTTFVIGHLVHHIKTHDEMVRFNEGMNDKIKSRVAEHGNNTTPVNMTDLVAENIQKRTENEGSAHIVGWKYVVDAATQANGGKKLVAEQGFFLMHHLRYAAYFFKAMETKPDYLVFLNPATIELNDRNIKAFGIALRTSPTADLP